MSALVDASFREFFHAIHGCEPFPWQQRLLQRALTAEKPWPDAIAMPTASGKTSCIDIALFALAAQADRPASERTAPRRIVFVVDRRIIVDEAFERALKIAKALREAKSGICAELALRLRKISGDSSGNPLGVVSLRGGTAKDQTWARSATQPLVICSTVDQLGSRLLFRGYGLKEQAQPIHAGLVGNDMLIFLDEAHIAKPFMQTAKAVEFYRRHAVESLPLHFRFVIMSATPPPTTDVFPVSSDELEPDRQHPVLGPRWKAEKPASLLIIEGVTKKNFWLKLGEKMAYEAMKLASNNRQVIAVFVNRVATAKAVHDVLREKNPDRCILLMGRMRPVDRDRVVKQAEEQFKLSTSSARDRFLEKPVFIVATQCLEVGADMDFDGLVTECASLDALLQRFGRLNRGGRNIEAKATIVIRGDQIEAASDTKDSDPVYGDALAATWKWLNRIASENVVNFGIEALRAPLSALSFEEYSTLRLNQVNAPVMMPAHVGAWCQTNEPAVPSPEPSLFLHGRSAAAPEIALCWRADLEMPPKDAVDRLSLCPPASTECLNIPLWQFHQWLNEGAPLKEENELSAFETDISSADPNIATQEKRIEQKQFMLCWRGETLKGESLDEGDDNDDESFVVDSPASASKLRHSDILVLAPETAAFWLGEDFKTSSGVDIGDAVQLTTRGRPTLRLDKKLIETWPYSEGKTALLALCSGADLAEKFDARDSLRDEIVECLKSVAETVAPGFAWLRRSASCLIREFADLRRFERSVHLTGYNGLVLRSSRRWRKEQMQDGGELFPESSFASSRSSKAVTLREHTDGVEYRVREMALAAGLSPALVNLLALAARCHDLGKADPRFQALLLGLKEASSAILLAKSARLSNSREAAEEQRQAAGYPTGGRHELLSVRLAESSSTLPNDGWERDLVLHLIAAHHGYCRPWAPVVFDAEAPAIEFLFGGVHYSHQGPTQLERIGSGIAERFWRLNERFGPWGLAYLESLLRLADQQQSASEQSAEEIS